MDVAALFVRSDSIYKSLPGVDCFDIERDALTFPGGKPVVCHPPCRAWGVLRKFAKPRPGEKALAPWAVNQVRDLGRCVGASEREQFVAALQLTRAHRRV